MVTFLKYMLAGFVLVGIAISLYGGLEILGTLRFVRNTPERAKGFFRYYVTEEVQSHSTTTDVFGNTDSGYHTSVMSYPHFEFTSKDGKRYQVTETKHHFVEWFKPDQEIEVIVSPSGNHRIAGFHSLYLLDILILALGVGFILIPLLIGKFVIPSLATPQGRMISDRMTEEVKEIFSSQVGPIRVSTILKGTGIFVALVLFISLVKALNPFVEQLHLGFGWGLMKALQEERFDEARQLILEKKGINKTDEYNRTPLHLALEKGRTDLARLLVEAGVDLNSKNKMILKTPIEIAAYSGDLEMVRLLLAKGALPDADNDESPPIFKAIMNGRDEIARVLVESGCDIKRLYTQGGTTFTVGDLAVAARRPELAALIRRRGGVFTGGLTQARP
ncbi:MAG: ankyrin repeat domain-containing protein [Thermodesulfobacteriota bacterium]